MRGGSLLLFFCSCFIFSLPLRSDRGRFSRLLFFSSLSLLLFVFFGCSDGMEREACVCDHGYERSDLCAEIIIIIIITYDQVFSQANASLKSHAGAESQGVPQSYSCIYEAPSEDKDVEASSETSDSTRLAEPGHSTTTAAPAVDLELLDQEVNGNVKINVRFEYTAPFLSS